MKKFFILTVSTIKLFYYLTDRQITLTGEIDLSSLGIENSELTSEEQSKVYTHLIQKALDEMNVELFVKLPSTGCLVTNFYYLS